MSNFEEISARLLCCGDMFSAIRDDMDQGKLKTRMMGACATLESIQRDLNADIEDADE